MSEMETKIRGDPMDRKTVVEFELLIRFHEIQLMIDRTTDADMVRQMEERKKEISEQLEANR